MGEFLLRQYSIWGVHYYAKDMYVHPVRLKGLKANRNFFYLYFHDCLYYYITEVFKFRCG